MPSDDRILLTGCCGHIGSRATPYGLRAVLRVRGTTGPRCMPGSCPGDGIRDAGLDSRCWAELASAGREAAGSIGALRAVVDAETTEVTMSAGLGPTYTVRGPGEDPGPPRTARGCYCGLWETQPEFFLNRGVPEGHCGHCRVCGEPGHTRHHPGAPVTDCWCDRHYRRVEATHPGTPTGCAIWLTVAGLLVLFAGWLFG